jgi:hypothetical protein
MSYNQSVNNYNQSKSLVLFELFEKKSYFCSTNIRL